MPASTTADPWFLGWLVLGFFTVPFLWAVPHELAHALVGRLAGFRILACGIGSGRILFKKRIGRTVYYLAGPSFGGGLTIPSRKSPPASRLAHFAVCAAGPFVDLTIAATVLALWCAGVRHGFLAGALLVSVSAGWMNLCPGRVPISKGVQLSNDGLIIATILGRSRPQTTDPGSEIAEARWFRDLLGDLDVWEGAIDHGLDLAFWLAVVDDHESALETLADPHFVDPRRGAYEVDREREIRAIAQASATPADASRILRDAYTGLDTDPAKDAYLLLLEAQFALASARPAGDLLRRYLARQAESGIPNPVLESTARALLIEAEPPDDPACPAKALLEGEKGSALHPLTALHLAAWTSGALARTGRLAECRHFFDRAVNLLWRQASTLQDLTTCRRFIERNSIPLAEVAPLLGIPTPIRREAVETPGAEAAQASVAVGATAFLFAAGSLLRDEPMHVRGFPLEFAVPAFLASIGLLVATFEKGPGRQTRTFRIALLLNFATIATPIAIAILRAIC